METMRHEYEFQVNQSEYLLPGSHEEGCCIPHHLTYRMPTNTPQQLQRALHHFREENNRMTKHIAWVVFRWEVEELGWCGEHDHAHENLICNMQPEYASEFEISNENYNT